MLWHIIKRKERKNKESCPGAKVSGCWKLVFISFLPGLYTSFQHWVRIKGLEIVMGINSFTLHNNLVNQFHYPHFMNGEVKELSKNLLEVLVLFEVGGICSMDFLVVCWQSLVFLDLQKYQSELYLYLHVTFYLHACLCAPFPLFMRT